MKDLKNVDYWIRLVKLCGALLTIMIGAIVTVSWLGYYYQNIYPDLHGWPARGIPIITTVLFIYWMARFLIWTNTKDIQFQSIFKKQEKTNSAKQIKN